MSPNTVSITSKNTSTSSSVSDNAGGKVRVRQIRIKGQASKRHHPYDSKSKIEDLDAEFEYWKKKALESYEEIKMLKEIHCPSVPKYVPQPEPEPDTNVYRSYGLFPGSYPNYKLSPTGKMIPFTEEDYAIEREIRKQNAKLLKLAKAAKKQTK